VAWSHATAAVTSPAQPHLRLAQERRRPTDLYGRELVLGRIRLWALRTTGVLLTIAGAGYLSWRVSTLGGFRPFAIAFLAAEIAAYIFSVLTVVLLWRPRWRSRPPAAPAGTLDIFIPVCGEPAALVESTVRAAKQIRWADKRIFILNDGLRANKANWRDIDELGRRLGVAVFTRTEVEGPRGKAGNMNHALSRTDGEFIAVIDADHSAVETFAHETLGYFVDRDVALVVSPQQFRTHGADPLNNRELLFYQLIQAAKDGDNAAFSCGNAVLYRRSALEEIGGFSEWGVVEDLHTSYRLHSAGFRSIYHGRALTIGLAPETTAAYVKQRLTWATDGLRLFLWDNPLRNSRLTFRQRLHYFHTAGFYLFAILQLLFLAGPALYLLAGVSVMRPTSGAAYATFGAPYYLGMLAYLFSAGGLRGAIGGLQSSLSLSPTYLLAVGRALLLRPRSTHVTPKVKPPRFTPLLLPQQLIFVTLLVSIVVAVRHPQPGSAPAAAWAAYCALALSAVVTGLARSRRRSALLRSGARWAVVCALAAAVLLHLPNPLETGRAAAAGALQSAAPVPARSSVFHRRVLLPPVHGVYLGVFNPDLLRGRHALQTWNRRHGVRPVIAHWFQQWGSGETRFRSDWLAMIARQGAVPMITWEPWRKPADAVISARQPRFRLGRIAAGAFDPYIRSWARAAAAYGKPILLRPMHEMNGNWYPWSVQTNGNTPQLYIEAWRRIVHIFRAEHASNVSFVWTINSFAGLRTPTTDLQSFYPGKHYVDWVSATGFNWGAAHPWNAWRTFDQVFAKTYQALTSFHKPIMLSEVGTTSTGGDASQWIRASLHELPSRYPAIKALIWFDSPYPGAVNFQLSGRSADAFRQSVNRDDLLRETLRLAPTAR
jgi:cellulose synthase/poly-beta-1,6-N-acetylglucosamine synthase-like glycosyltransferase